MTMRKSSRLARHVRNFWIPHFVVDRGHRGTCMHELRWHGRERRAESHKWPARRSDEAVCPCPCPHTWPSLLLEPMAVDSPHRKGQRMPVLLACSRHPDFFSLRPTWIAGRLVGLGPASGIGSGSGRGRQTTGRAMIRRRYLLLQSSRRCFRAEILA